MRVRLSSKQLGIIFIILSALSFSIMNVFVKLAVDVPTMQKCFWRALPTALFALAVLKRNRVDMRVSRSDFWMLIIRSATGVTGTLTNYYAVSHLLMPDATILNKTAAFFAILFSFLFLKEKITPKQVGLILLAFLGCLLVIKPGFAFNDVGGSISGMVCGISAGASYVAVRCLGNRGVNGHLTVLYFSVFSCLVTLPSLILEPMALTAQNVFYLAMIALFGAGGQYGITAAYYHAPARDISIYDYTIVIFASIWSLLIWNEVPDLFSFAGYCVIFGAQLLMFFQGHRNAAAGAVSSAEATVGGESGPGPAGAAGEDASAHENRVTTPSKGA